MPSERRTLAPVVIAAAIALTSCRRTVTAQDVLHRVELARISPDAITFLSDHVDFQLMGAVKMVAALQGLAATTSVPPSLQYVVDPERMNAITRSGLSELDDAWNPQVMASIATRLSDQIAGRSCTAQPADRSIGTLAQTALRLDIPSTIDPTLATRFAPMRARAATIRTFFSVVCARPFSPPVVIGREEGATRHEFVIIRLPERR